MINMLKYVLLLALVTMAASCTTNNPDKESKITERIEAEKAEYAMIIHGGAGTVKREYMSPERDSMYRSKLTEVLHRGSEILNNGGSSIDAVEECIKIMENSPLFNAGKGAVFTHDATNELDASIMVGSDLNAGAVAGVTTVKNPISAARAVMERSAHVLLARDGAEQFADSVGLERVEPSYFHTDRTYDALQNALKEEAKKKKTSPFKEKFGTVGVVALDKYGRMAAGTSTGGMTNKRYGRIGDSPIIGAGTYVDDRFGGVSCTGHGEYFIRHAVAYDVVARMAYSDQSVQEASHFIIDEKLKSIDALGGLIALDNKGNYAMPFNTAGMYRGYIQPKDTLVKLYGDE